MHRTLKRAGLGVLALCAISSAACQSNTARADELATHQEHVFRECDENFDDRIDVDEFKRYFYVISFEHHDANEDDQLTLVEWVGPDAEPDHEVMFREMDGDGSGWLVLEEYSSHPVRTITVTNAFHTLDHDGDSYIVLADFND